MKTEYTGVFLNLVAVVFFIAFFVFFVAGFLGAGVEENFTLAFGFLISGILTETLRFLKLSTFVKLERLERIETAMKELNVEEAEDESYSGARKIL